MRKISPRRALFKPPIPSGNRLGEHVRIHLLMQIETLRISFQQLWKTPVASTMTVLVVAVALALPASFHAMVNNARHPIEALQTTSQISLFLKPEASDEQARKLANLLGQNARISRTQLVTKAEGLKELVAYSGFGDALAALSSNPLPAVIIIEPRPSDADSVTQLLTELKTLPQADRVQFDFEWLRKLQALLMIAHRSVTAFGILLGFGVLFIIGNTVRLELQNRHEEIIVAKLLGATNRFIRRPFLHAGIWYAFLGACLAWLLSNGLILGIREPANQLAELYHSTYRLSFLGVQETLLLIAVSIALGMSSGWVVVWHYLRDIDPD